MVKLLNLIRICIYLNINLSSDLFFYYKRPELFGIINYRQFNKNIKVNFNQT